MVLIELTPAQRDSLVRLLSVEKENDSNASCQQSSHENGFSSSDTDLKNRHMDQTGSCETMKLLSRVKATFDREGVVILRGLLEEELVEKLVKGGEELVRQEEKEVGAKSSPLFSSLKFGPVFLSPELEEGEQTTKHHSTSTNNMGQKQALLPQESKYHEKGESETGKLLGVFREVALRSILPAFIAQVLLQIDSMDENSNVKELSKTRNESNILQSTRATNNGRSLRVLKDAFLGKGIREEKHCGWHVDDFYFWPTSAHKDHEDAMCPPDGVNVWIALDDMPKKYGGGMAVCPRSHRENGCCAWRDKAHSVIGSPKTHPPEGYESSKEMFSAAPATTCTLAVASPELADEIEQSGLEFDFRTGDVLLHTRWLFHKSVALTVEGRERLIQEAKTSGMAPVLKRYSIRYEPGDAKLISGFSVEPSVALHPSYAGKTLDEVCGGRQGANEEEGADSSSSKTDKLPWYPQCWPHVDEDEMKNLNSLVKEALPAAQLCLTEKFKKMNPYAGKKRKEEKDNK